MLASSELTHTQATGISAVWSLLVTNLGHSYQKAQKNEYNFDPLYDDFNISVMKVALKKKLSS